MACAAETAAAVEEVFIDEKVVLGKEVFKDSINEDLFSRVGNIKKRRRE